MIPFRITEIMKVLYLESLELYGIDFMFSLQFCVCSYVYTQNLSMNGGTLDDSIIATLSSSGTCVIVYDGSNDS